MRGSKKLRKMASAMSKITKPERERNARRRARSQRAAFSEGVGDAIGIGTGAYIAGRFTAGKQLGPLSWNQWLGLGGAAAKLLLPSADKGAIMSGVTSAMVTAGATDLFVLGGVHRLKAGITGN